MKALVESGRPIHQLGEDEPIVVFNDVSIGFDGKKVLDHISFEVDRGQTLIILGPAGCGKSVLMKLVNGLMCPDSGTITVFGQDVTRTSEKELFALRAHIGMVFQESALFDSLSVADNVAYRLHEDRMDEPQIHERVVEALHFVELEHAIDRFPSQLSGGMRRRVSIARAIITGPDLTLYDSPTGGLDPITSTTIIELVVKQRDVSHTTSLLITHRIQDAFAMATHRFNSETGHMEPLPDNGVDHTTRFLVMNAGGVVYHGDTLGLVHSEDPWIKDYLA
jgi:phospholipid/cholesterol/gamma-HCH transport system ATP-binding protein